MKHPVSLLLAIALLVTAPAAAQRRRTTATPKAPAIPVTERARQAMDVYDFDGAAELLSTTIEEQRKKRKSTEDIPALEKQLRTAQRLATKLHATERIVVIDSVVVPAEQALQAIRLTRESGRLDTYASTYHTPDSLGATLYENELANKRYLAIPTSLRLAVSDKIGDTWSSPILLTGLGDDDTAQNFPFLLSDGVTLYYAACGPESIGGYDIFVTRADGEDGTFLAPENVGFPFNSTANDYLLAIDELAQLGWFVTDRRQPEGQVCVYTFIPNDTREVYDDETTDEQLRAFARLASIRDTWLTTNDGQEEREALIAEARQRLADLRAGKAFGQTVVPDFVFPIDDSRTYTNLADFKSATAREKMQQYQQLSKTIDTDATMLQRLRDNYATAQPALRRQLAETILRIERTHYPQLQQRDALAKEIRNLEINHK